MNFSPTVYLFTGLLQTAFNSFRKPKQVNYSREYIKLQDGGQISLDWAKPITYQKDENIENVYNINQKNNKSNNNDYKKGFRIEREYEPQNDQKIMFIVHGLTGGSDGNYIQQLVRTCQKNGFRVVAYNSRGVNNQMTSPMPNNGVDLSDLDIALNKVKERYPEAPIFAVGTSFGGNQILRWTAQQQKENGYCFLKGVIGLSVPFDVQNVMNNMGKLYQYVLVDFYKKNLVNPHMEQLQKLTDTHNIDWNKVQKAKDLKTFYEETACKVFGYESVIHLYNDLTIKDDDIKNLKIPVLLMHARDDPVVSINSLPINQISQNKNILYLQTNFGGHVCWFQGKQAKRWYPKPTVIFCDQILEQYQQQKKDKTILEESQQQLQSNKIQNQKKDSFNLDNQINVGI